MRWLLPLLLAGTLAAHAADVSGLDWEQRPGAQAPIDAELLDADGARTTLRRVAEGHALILAPGYFKCPNLCGVIRDDLFAALPSGEARVALLSIDPAETPADAARARNAVLDRYPRAQFAALTGPPGNLAAIEAAIGFHARYDATAKQFLHPAGLVVLGPDGTVSGYRLGVGYATSDLERDIADAQAGMFRRAEPIHLFCFSYDPVTGRFTATVMEIVRTAAVLTVLAIGAMLLRLGRRA
jgi:protein SCO1/2